MKHIHRFFSSTILVTGSRPLLGDDDSFHASRVLRLRRGDALEISDAQGALFEARVEGTRDGSMEVLVGSRLADPPGAAEAPVALTVLQALPKGRKLDMVVEKLSELGVDRLVPVYSEKSVARDVPDREGKVERWRRIARAAAGQAKRRRIMAVEDPVRLEEWLPLYEGALLVLSTEVEGAPLGEAVLEAAAPAGDGAALALAIGPEAGFSDAEIEAFHRHGARFVSMGPLVLRTETAALAAATVVMHRLGAIG